MKTSGHLARRVSSVGEEEDCDLAERSSALSWYDLRRLLVEEDERCAFGEGVGTSLCRVGVTVVGLLVDASLVVVGAGVSRELAVLSMSAGILSQEAVAAASASESLLWAAFHEDWEALPDDVAAGVYPVSVSEAAEVEVVLKSRCGFKRLAFGLGGGGILSSSQITNWRITSVAESESSVVKVVGSLSQRGS